MKFLEAIDPEGIACTRYGMFNCCRNFPFRLY